jgi:hypothetical protein
VNLTTRIIHPPLEIEAIQDAIVKSVGQHLDSHAFIDAQVHTRYEEDSVLESNIYRRREIRQLELTVIVDITNSTLTIKG